MTDHETPPAGSIPWVQGLVAIAGTFSVVMGAAGFGMMGGFGYGAWVASRSKQDDLSWIAWLVCLPLYGSIGFVIGLAAGLIGMVLVWVVRLVKGLRRGSGQ